MSTPLLAPQGGQPREVAKAANAALLGKINSVGTVTLADGVTSTVVSNVLVSEDSKIFLFPNTANAAGEFGAGTIYIAPGDIVSGTSFEITHANAVSTDRTFFYVILG